MIKNKKGAGESEYELLKVVLIILAIGLVVLGMYKLGILSKLNIFFPDFGKNNTGTGAQNINDTNTTGSFHNVTYTNLKDEIIITDKLKQQLITSINNGYEIHIQLNAADKSKPIIYSIKTEQKQSGEVVYIFNWDYNQEAWKFLDKTQRPQLSEEVIIRKISDLKTVLGITA